MKNLRLLIAILAFGFVVNSLLAARNLPMESSSVVQTQPENSQHARADRYAGNRNEKRVTGYTLPPETYKKAHDLGRIYFRISLISFFYGLLTLWIILHWRLAPKYRDWAQKFSSQQFLQAVVFVASVSSDQRYSGIARSVFMEIDIAAVRNLRAGMGFMGMGLDKRTVPFRLSWDLSDFDFVPHYSAIAPDAGGFIFG